MQWAQTHRLVPHTRKLAIRPRVSRALLRNDIARVRLRLLQPWRLLPVDVHPLLVLSSLALALALALVYVHLRLFLLALAFPLRARDLREHLRALLYPARIEARLRHLGRELGERAQTGRARERGAVLHRLLRALRHELLLARVLGGDGLALVLRVVLQNGG